MAEIVASLNHEDRIHSMMNRRSFVGLGAVAAVAACAAPGMMAAPNLPPPLKPPVPGKPMPISLSAITTEGARTTTSIVNLIAIVSGRRDPAPLTV